MTTPSSIDKIRAKANTSNLKLKIMVAVSAVALAAGLPLTAFIFGLIPMILMAGVLAFGGSPLPPLMVLAYIAFNICGNVWPRARWVALGIASLLVFGPRRITGAHRAASRSR